MPTKDTKILSVRIKNDLIAQIEKRAKVRGITVNHWLHNAILRALGIKQAKTGGQLENPEAKDESLKK